MSITKANLVRVTLPELLGLKVIEAKIELKSRGVEVKAEDILKATFENIDHKYIATQIENLTPKEFHFEEAKKDPEILAILIAQYKKLLEAKDAGKPLVTRRGRRPKVANEAEKLT